MRSEWPCNPYFKLSLIPAGAPRLHPVAAPLRRGPVAMRPRSFPPPCPVVRSRCMSPSRRRAAGAVRGLASRSPRRAPSPRSRCHAPSLVPPAITPAHYTRSLPGRRDGSPVGAPDSRPTGHYTALPRSRPRSHPLAAPRGMVPPPRHRPRWLTAAMRPPPPVGAPHPPGSHPRRGLRKVTHRIRCVSFCKLRCIFR